MAIVSRFPSGGSGISEEEALAFVNGAHIEFSATAGDNTLHLRTQVGGFDCTIHWGDGQKTLAPANGGNVIHNYAQAGVYHIFITGKSFAGLYVNNQSGREKYTAAHSMGRWENDTATSFSYCFYGCSNLASISASLFRHNTVATDFNGCFRDCTGLISLPASLFQYNTAATVFSHCFRGCTGLASLPASLFQYNTAVTHFAYCFYSCYGLASLPASLFQYNTAATDFSSCFYSCYGLIMRNDMFGVDYTGRFAGKSVYFTNCFYRANFTGTQGIAPILWGFTFGSVTSTGCFGGAGNSETSLSNYIDIPAAWK